MTLILKNQIIQRNQFDPTKSKFINIETKFNNKKYTLIYNHSNRSTYFVDNLINLLKDSNISYIFTKNGSNIFPVKNNNPLTFFRDESDNIISINNLQNSGSNLYKA